MADRCISGDCKSDRLLAPIIKPMARPLRLELSGGVYHVTSRGDRREDIYLSDADREMWLGVFAEAEIVNLVVT